MNKSILMLMAFSLIFPLSSCDTKKYRDDIKIGFITDYHDVIEDSFYKETYEKVKKWCDDNRIELLFRKPNGNTNENRKTALKIVIEEKCNYIFTVGSQFGECIENVIDKYPMHKFIGVGITKDDLLKGKYKDYNYNINDDRWKDYQVPSNLYCYSFKNEQLGYTLGYSLIKDGYSDVGFLGSYNRSEIVRYGYGYIQGINDAAKEMNKEVTIRYAYANYPKTDSDITARLDTWFGLGMKAIFACGDYMYSSVYKSATKDGIKKVKIINEEVDRFEKYNEGESNLYLTNTIVNYGEKAVEIIDKLIKKDNGISNYEEIGMNEDINSSKMKLNGKNWGYASFSYDDYKDIVSKIVKGQIKVSSLMKGEPQVDELVTLLNQGNIKL